MATVAITVLNQVYGRDATNRLTEASQRGVAGARAALETFYYAFNHRHIETFTALWVSDPLAQLNNPLGGILRGTQAITRLYQRIFNSAASVWVEFGDAVEYATADIVIFAGRETGEFRRHGLLVPLSIRTTRIFTYDDTLGRWAQAHHHGSIDAPDALRAYQQAVKFGDDPESPSDTGPA